MKCSLVSLGFLYHFIHEVISRIIGIILVLWSSKKGKVSKTQLCLLAPVARSMVNADQYSNYHRNYKV